MLWSEFQSNHSNHFPLEATLRRVFCGLGISGSSTCLAPLNCNGFQQKGRSPVRVGIGLKMLANKRGKSGSVSDTVGISAIY